MEFELPMLHGDPTNTDSHAAWGSQLRVWRHLSGENVEKHDEILVVVDFGGIWDEKV